jgi:hypothetical protein
VTFYESNILKIIQNYTEIMKKNNGEDPNFFPINQIHQMTKYSSPFIWGGGKDHYSFCDTA